MWDGTLFTSAAIESDTGVRYCRNEDAPIGAVGLSISAAPLQQAGAASTRDVGSITFTTFVSPAGDAVNPGPDPPLMTTFVDATVQWLSIIVF